MDELRFTSSWAKIRRAQKIRDGLERDITATLQAEANAVQVGARFDAASGDHILFVSAMPDLTDFLQGVGLAVGDIVHNLRGALDHLMWQLATRHTGNNIRRPREVQFPICDTEVEYRRSRAWREIHPDHQATVEQFQPFRGLAGSTDTWSGPYIHQLSLLRNLSNVDKHRVINTVLVGASFSYTSSSPISALIEILGLVGRLGDAAPIPHGPLRPGAVLMRARVPPPPLAQTLANVGRATPVIELPEGRTVIPTVDRMIAFVKEIVSQFESNQERGAGSL